jgi:hypothetical protein
MRLLVVVRPDSRRLRCRCYRRVDQLVLVRTMLEAATPQSTPFFFMGMNFGNHGGTGP